MQSKIVICRANPLAPDPRVDKIARALADDGCEVTAVGWDMNAELPTEENRQDYNIQRIPLYAEFGRGLSNIRHQVRWQVALMRWLARNRRQYQVIHACDFDTVLPALFCKAFYGKKVVYDIFDFYADMLRATPRSVMSLIRWMELKAINRVDAVILADESRLDQIRGSNPKYLEFIYNTAENHMSDFSEAKTSSSTSTTLRIAYVGNIQVERGLLVLLELLKDHPQWALNLAGFGGDVAQIRDVAQKLPNVSWHGRVPYERGLQLSHSVDVLLATYDPDIPNNRYASPNKIFEAMMLGKPVVVARDTNMDRIIREQDCGLVVDYGNKKELESALTTLDQDPHLRQRLGVNARKAFDRQYNWEIMKQRLLSLYREITPT